jgi:tetratricopeptide (TPR) repeat protein
LNKSNEELLAAGNLLEKAMEVSPLDDEIYSLYRWVRRGNEYKYHSDNDWFIRVCEPYARKYPQNEGLLISLVESMISQKYFDKAEEIIRMMQPSVEQKFMKEILLGDVQVKKGNTEAAKEIWMTVSKEDWRAQYEVGERLNRLSEYEDAIACFKRAYELQKAPKRALDMVYSLAFLYKKLGRYADAMKAWECILLVLAEDYGLTEGNDVEWANSEIKQLKDLVGVK